MSHASQVSYATRVKSLLLCVGGLAACVGTLTPPVPPRQSQISLEITNATLQNGLRIVLVRDPRAAEVQVTMQYHVGSVDDPAGQAGMAHLVEHLMFQQVLGAQSLFAKLEEASTSFNAETQDAVTTYTSRARPERLDELLSIEAVRVGFRCTSISDATFTREREVVAQELRLKDAGLQFQNAVYQGVYPAAHPYHRANADTAETVSKITRDQACIFADTHYTTTNAVLVVSGNVTAARVDEALGKFLGRVQKRESFAAPVAIPEPEISRRATVNGPVDEEVLLFTWPMPADRGERIKVQMAALIVELYIDAAIRGTTTRYEVGDEKSRMLVIAAYPRGPQGDIVKTVTEKLALIEKAPAKGPRSFWDRVAFTMLHSAATFGVFESYEEGSQRDEALAHRVHEGVDPRLALPGDASALRTLTIDDALRVLREQLNTKRMSVITMKPREGAKHGVDVKTAAPVHDMRERRDPPDVAEAKRPVAETAALPALDLKRERTLPNGLRVVLLPVTSVPTVEARLVFRVGTADEPPNQRGAALVAARGLGWPRGYERDYLNFLAAGASPDVEVDHDTTVFVARGLDMHLDFLLTGIARWIRRGSYSGKLLRELRALVPGEEADLQDAWRAAIYGDGHPYVRGGLARHIDPKLTVDDVLEFHVAHFTPANATLVIAGKFDAALAERWIDHLFADWKGRATDPPTQRSSLRAVSLGVDDDLAQTHVSITLPATGSRATRLVLAQMLDDIVGDVRHQLAASYAFDASLVEMRLSSTYQLEGAIDATRTQEALELVKTRIAALREDPDAAARAFVSARKRTLAQLGRLTGSAHELAARAQQDIRLARPIMSDAGTVAEVQRLTIDQMTGALAELDLARAAIVMRGPAANTDPAFAALGRTARRIPKNKVSATQETEDDAEIDDSIEFDERPLPVGQRLLLGANAGYGFMSARTHALTGYAIGADAGYRLTRETTVGLHAGFGRSSGSYTERELQPPIDIAATGLQLQGFIQATGYERLWAAALIGVGVVRVEDDGRASWHGAASAGLQGGVDVIDLDGHRLGLYARLETDLFSETSYSAFSIGVGYRH